MSPRTEPRTDGPRAPRGTRRGPLTAFFAGAGRAVRRWLPVAAPLALFAQVSLLGLRPALAERRHLARMASEIEARHAADLDLQQELALRCDARLDPIFRERQRRLGVGPWSER
jgi:hypothetical protein